MCLRNLCFVGAREGGDEGAVGRRAGGSPASGAAPPGPPALASRPALRLYPHDFSRYPCIFVGTTKSCHVCVYSKELSLNIGKSVYEKHVEGDFLCGITRPARPTAQISRMKQKIRAKKNVLYAYFKTQYIVDTFVGSNEQFHRKYLI